MKKDFINKILDGSSVFIIAWDLEGNLIKFNKYSENTTGFNEQELLGKKWTNTFLNKENEEIFMKVFSDIEKQRSNMSYEGKIRCKNGENISVLWNNILLDDSKGKGHTIVSMGVDISERKNTEKKLSLSYQELEALHEELAATEEELREKYYELQVKEQELQISEERFRLCIDGARDAVWDYDIKRNESFVSDRWAEMLGYEPSELRVNHLTWKDLIHPDDKEKAFQIQQDHLNGKTPFYYNEYRLKAKNGKYKWFLVRGKVLRDEKGNPIRIAGSQTDISERKNFEEKIKFMAHYDPLTGLPNRAYFEKLLDESICDSIENQTKGAVLFLDLDNFKTVNDTYGHSMGDDLLRSVGNLLRSFESDNIKISRFGGDEFVIMFNNIQNDKDVIDLASNIVQALNKPWVVMGMEFYNTVSMGIVYYPYEGCSAQNILSNADCAMYSVKKSGKGNYSIYSSNMNSMLMERINMENSLRHALERNEFSLYYQPQINQKTGEIVGAEALIRWNHPTKGLISPGVFIPMAEETGLIIPIGEWVLREACMQNKAWQEKGYNKFPISVNLSAQQLKQPNIVENIKAILEETGLEAKWLALEITESIAISNIDFATKVLKDLKDIGVSIALDDFGTGYSSLSYLRRLPINVIKIDKSFVDEINNSEHGAAIIEAIIIMSHKMNIKVVAEGVETWNQYEFLNNEQCDIAQGYLFSKPLVHSHIEKLIMSKESFIKNTSIN